jgi:outer membrane protein OmpA-like peptidoglycan-associated protein
MLRTPIAVKRGSKGEPEKPFWISYADLMTALMVLFLVVMSVALLAITKTASEASKTVSEIERQKIVSERKRVERERDISKLLEEVQKAARRYPGVKVDRERNIIDFGDKARFEKAKSTLNVEQARLLRAFAPEILTIARDDLGRKWLKRVVVEGFASPEGDYLYNLNLSLQRSQRVICVLFAKQEAGERPITDVEREQIRDLFLVGGYSFNAAKYNTVTANYDESRRVELRLEFLGIGEARPAAEVIAPGNIGKCALEG